MLLNAALGSVEGRSEGADDGSELERSDGIELGWIEGLSVVA